MATFKSPYSVSSFNPESGTVNRPPRMIFQDARDTEKINFSGNVFRTVDETPLMFNPCCSGQNTIEMPIPCVPSYQNMNRSRYGTFFNNTPDSFVAQANSGYARNQTPGLYSIALRNTDFNPTLPILKPRSLFNYNEPAMIHRK